MLWEGSYSSSNREGGELLLDIHSSHVKKIPQNTISITTNLCHGILHNQDVSDRAELAKVFT